MISLLVAMDKNRVIGNNNEMPWHLPDDLRYFKETTIGKTIIMGRKTFESIGRVLPKRENVVLTRSDLTFPNDVKVIRNLETVKEWNEKDPTKEFFIIGGGNIFKQAFSFADRLYITLIEEEFPGDVYFPDIPLEREWKLVSSTKGLKNETNPYDYYYQIYERK